MNLHAVAGPIVAAINPMVIGSLLASTGNTIGPDGTQHEHWSRADGLPFQVQALTSDDLKQIDNINISSGMRAVYLNGNVRGIERYAGKGGDVLVFAGSAWLVTQVLEPWDLNGWTKVVVTLQGPSSTVLRGSVLLELKAMGVF